MQQDFKLGKRPAEYDHRNITLPSIFRRELPVVPTAFDSAGSLAGQPVPMFGNDLHGDCVLAARAHQQLHFEFVEQHKIIDITDCNVIAEYYKETNGQDTGLSLLQSLKCWCKGWYAAKRLYVLDSFASIDKHDLLSIRQAIYFLCGAQAGVQLPINLDLRQLTEWSDTSEPIPSASDERGHAINLVAYDQTSFTIETWGRRQKVSTAWLQKYADEMYACVDARDPWLTHDTINVPALEAALAVIHSQNVK